MSTIEVVPLPTYPSASARKSLSASQLATFHRNISSTLAKIITLPSVKRDTSATRAFLSSYVNDIAHQTLQSLIWEAPPHSDDCVHKRVLLLADKLASSSSALDAKNLLDIAIAYFPYPTRVRALFVATLASTPNLAVVFASDIVSALTTLLSPSRSAGLYGLRKTARCLVSLLSVCPPELVRPFAEDQVFMMALAQAYDEGLATLARSYGGLRMNVVARELDDWERIWIETKVDLVDSFHIIITVMLQSLSVASGAALAERLERTFSVVFALSNLQPPPPPVQANSTTVSVPFLNQSLIADYQHSYDLARTLTPALRRAAREDARVDRLDSTLHSYDIESSTGTKDPGVLKLIIKSSGAPPSTSAPRKGRGAPSLGKSKAIGVISTLEPASNHDLDLQISQVMDIFPDQSVTHIRALLTNPSFPYRGNAEKVIEALLEGTAPGEDLLTKDSTLGTHAQFVSDEPIERRNIFDDEVLDVTKIHVGKRNQDEASVFKDRAAIEQMKADILRRAEAMSNEEEELVEVEDDLGFGDEVKVIGDGEASDEGEQDDNEDGAPPFKPNPDIIMELAYIRDPELFNRDANTRRSKARSELKAQTGLSDEQIEGWRIMLERNPKKDKILQKHEFSGNKAIDFSATRNVGGPEQSSRGGDRGRGRGGYRAGRGGHGAGMGRGRGEGTRDGGDGRERAWKDKNKASRGNHNRKRGHDKKMARAGPS